MSGKSPAQAAWEAFAAQRRGDLGSDFYAPAGWDDETPDAASWRAAWDAAAKAAITAGAPAELAAAMAETRQLRQVAAEIIAVFLPSGSGHTARVGQVQVRKWRERAGLETS